MDMNRRAAFNERLLRPPVFHFAAAFVLGRLSNDDLLLECMVQTGMSDISGGNSSISRRLDGLDVGTREEADDPPTRPLRRLQPPQSGVLGQFPQRSISDALSREPSAEDGAANRTRLNAHLPPRAQLNVEPQKVAAPDMREAQTKISLGTWTADDAIESLGATHDADIAQLKRWQEMAEQYGDEPPVGAETADAMPDRGSAASTATANRPSASEPGADPAADVAADLAEASRLLDLADSQRFSEENELPDLLNRAQQHVTRARDRADEMFASLFNAMPDGDVDTRQSLVLSQTAFLRQALSCARGIEAARVDPSGLTLLIPEIDKMVRGITDVNAP